MLFVLRMPTAWGDAVGDDAEYMMELQWEEEAAERLVHQSQMDARVKPLLTWADGELEVGQRSSVNGL
jgi:hypothetical protein